MAGSWTSGYVTEIGYQWGYFRELNPLRAQIAMLCNGLAFPEIKTACELGFGQGVSTNMHAAGSEMQWIGNDFNPSHAAVAKQMAEASGANAQVFDDSFAELSMREDVPEFDFIGLHGVWSWISDENRQELVDFIRAKLKVGGVVYISYNVHPGWSNFIPMRHLMLEYVERVTSHSKGIASRIDEAIEFAEKLVASKPVYAQANPQVEKRLENTKKQNRNYVAHEYFNRDWHPMTFLDMSRQLDQAKLSYICSAHFLEQVPSLTMTKEQREVYDGVSDQMLRHQLIDFMTNQLFRRDYWTRGIRRLSGSEQMEKFNDFHLLLVRHLDDVAYKIKGPIGEANLSEEIYRPVVELLSDYKPKSIGEIIRKLQSKKLTASNLLQAMIVLMGDNQIAPVNVDPSEKVRQQCSQLNSYIMNRSRDVDEIHFLTSPLTGGGFAVSRINQLFLLALQDKKSGEEQLAKFAWRFLSARNQRLVREGKPLETAEENLKELKARAGEFLIKSRPVYSVLGIQ
ncbi:MAG: class I SAM-dependent methyltransferase [Gammaproteobacteria bacterium]|nr:class I SAM-dependent methyltransferase [Gammaproteobacteria bacterium]